VQPSLTEVLAKPARSTLGPAPRHSGLASRGKSGDTLCCRARSLEPRPPFRPCSRAAFSPARVRSRTMARSNSAKQPSICMIMRPAGPEVSIASVKERKPGARGVEPARAGRAQAHQHARHSDLRSFRLHIEPAPPNAFAQCESRHELKKLTFSLYQ